MVYCISAGDHHESRKSGDVTAISLVSATLNTGNKDSIASLSSSCPLEEKQYPKRLDDLYTLMVEEGTAAASLNGST